MASRSETAISKFDDSVPKLLQRDILKLVLACYQQADKSVRRKYPWQEAQTMRGHTRRADIEVELRNVGPKYMGADAEAVPNATSSVFHSTLSMGNVRIIQSRLRNRNAVPKPSLFRSGYAEESAQGLLAFAEEKTPRKVIPIQEDSNVLTWILAHGYKKSDKSKPAFIEFKLLNQECNEWVAEIDLCKRFPEVVSEFYAPIVDAENQERRVRLKKGVRRGGREKKA